MPSNRGCMRMFDISNKFEMACVDTAWNLQANLVQMPDARFWYKCTNAAGDKAFAEEGELWTSCFSGGRVALKYLFNGSVRTAGDGDAVKVYKHCSSNAIILVRRPPSLCVIIHTREVDQTTHDVLLSCLQDPGIMRDVWQMQCLNSISEHYRTLSRSGFGFSFYDGINAQNRAVTTAHPTSASQLACERNRVDSM